MMTHIVAGILVLAASHLAFAQDETKETIWSSVLVTLYGDRSPLITPETSILTPLGAQQLYSAGSLFRNRYIAPSSNVSNDLIINGISPFGTLQ